MPFRDAIIDVLVTTAVGAVERGVPREELARTLREALEAAPPEMPALSDEARAREIVDRFWPTSDGPFVRVNGKPRDLERLVSEVAAALGAAREAWDETQTVDAMLRDEVSALRARAADLEGALRELYTFPRVKDLLAPSGSLGSIRDRVEAALASDGGSPQ